MSFDVKQAVTIAGSYLNDLFPTNGKTQLEEVEHDLHDDLWKVTFSYEDPNADPLGVRRYSGQPFQRVYKVVTVDSRGLVTSVKMR